MVDDEDRRFCLLFISIIEQGDAEAKSERGFLRDESPSGPEHAGARWCALYTTFMQGWAVTNTSAHCWAATEQPSLSVGPDTTVSPRAKVHHRFHIQAE